MSSSIRGSRGFSIYELMTVLAIIAICMSWAFPSFLDAMRTNRVASRTNELVTAINLARTESIRRGNDVFVCASGNASTCAGEWDDGFIIWNDANSNGAKDLGDEVLRVVGEQDGLQTTSAATFRSIRFNSRGIASNLPAPDNERVILLEPSNGCPTGTQLRRNLRVTTTGQVVVAKAACP